MMQQYNWCIGRLRLCSKFDIGQHPVCMAVGNEEWPMIAGSLLSKEVAIDEANIAIDGVDAECRP